MDLHSKQLWRKPAFMGVFLALAMICSYIEMLIPFDFGIPGVKTRTDEYCGRFNAVFDWNEGGILCICHKNFPCRNFVWQSDRNFVFLRWGNL